jgi:hypothetical protein
VTFHLRKSVCLNRMPSSSSWMQIAFLMVYGSPFLRVISWCSLTGVNITRNSLPDERGIKVLDRPLAVAAHAERVGHVARAILAQVKSVLAVMRVVRVAVRDDHLGKRDTPEHLHIGQSCVCRRRFHLHMY